MTLPSGMLHIVITKRNAKPSLGWHHYFYIVQSVSKTLNLFKFKFIKHY